MGLLRAFGKGVRGAAGTANQMLPQVLREQALAERDKRLREYEVEDRDIARQDAQAAADTARYEADYQREEEQEFLSRNDEDQKKLLDKQIAQIDQTMEAGGIDLDAQKQLKEVRQQLVNAETPEERADAYGLYLNLQGKDNADKFQATTLYGEENDFGVQSRTTGILNQSTGEIAPATMNGGPGSGRIPPEAIQELQANPTPEMRQFFDETFGVGASEKALGDSNNQAMPTTAPNTMNSAVNEKPKGLINMDPMEVTANRRPEPSLASMGFDFESRSPRETALASVDIDGREYKRSQHNLLDVRNRQVQQNAEEGVKVLHQLKNAPRRPQSSEIDKIKLALRKGLISQENQPLARKLVEEFG